MEKAKGYYSTTSAGPCITLLQERFKQLKRQREEREEKQFLDIHSSSSSSTSNNKRLLFSSSSSSSEKFKKQKISSHTNGFYFNNKDDELMLPKRRISSSDDDDDDHDDDNDDPLSLGLNNLSSKNMEYYRDIRRNQNLWQLVDKKSDYNRTAGGIRNFEIRDVDTSLHL